MLQLARRQTNRQSRTDRLRRPSESFRGDLGMVVASELFRDKSTGRTRPNVAEQM